MGTWTEEKADLLDFNKHMNGGDICESRYAIPRVTSLPE